jgi:hypothetical protein
LRKKPGELRPLDCRRIRPPDYSFGHESIIL